MQLKQEQEQVYNLKGRFDSHTLLNKLKTNIIMNNKPFCDTKLLFTTTESKFKTLKHVYHKKTCHQIHSTDVYN